MERRDFVATSAAFALLTGVSPSASAAGIATASDGNLPDLPNEAVRAYLQYRVQLQISADSGASLSRGRRHLTRALPLFLVACLAHRTMRLRPPSTQELKLWSQGLEQLVNDARREGVRCLIGNPRRIYEAPAAASNEPRRMFV